MRESDSVLSMPVERPFLVRCHASELLMSVRSGDGCSELAMLRMIERAFCILCGSARGQNCPEKL